MDALVAQAMAGVARVGAAAVEEPWGSVAGAPEVALWLRAGGWAVWRQAGVKAVVGLERPVVAPADEREVCPPAAAGLVTQLLGMPELGSVLAEALVAIAARGWRVPPGLLVPLLEVQSPAVRSAARGVLGARGRWLAAQQERWGWAMGQLELAALDEAELARRWAEGRLEERLAALRHVRAIAPEQAIAWLQGGLKQERVEVRVAMLEALEGTWRPQDEAFLEAQLDDRAGGVRAIAARGLAAFPDSALMGRMRARFEALRGADGTIGLPEDCPKDWVRDGIEPAVQAHGTGQRAWWLQQLVRLLPPGEDFTGQPHADALVQGQIEAVIRTRDTRHAPAAYAALKVLRDKQGFGHLRSGLKPLMPPAWRAQAWIDAMSGSWDDVGALTPAVLAPEATQAWLAALEDRFEREQGREARSAPYGYLQDPIALAIAPGQLPLVAQRLGAMGERYPEITARMGKSWPRFKSILQLRRRIHEEIAP